MTVLVQLSSCPCLPAVLLLSMLVKWGYHGQHRSHRGRFLLAPLDAVAMSVRKRELEQDEELSSLVQCLKQDFDVGDLVAGFQCRFKGVPDPSSTHHPCSPKERSHLPHG